MIVRRVTIVKYIDIDSFSVTIVDWFHLFIYLKYQDSIRVIKVEKDVDNFPSVTYILNGKPLPKVFTKQNIMANDEIPIPLEEEPRFKFEHEIGSDTRVFSFSHLPPYGLLSPNPQALLIPGMAMAAFNPSSLEALNMVKDGDLIQVTGNPEHEIYKAWGPPPEYQIPVGFSRMYRVRLRVEDALEYPIIVADEAI